MQVRVSKYGYVYRKSIYLLSMNLLPYKEGVVDGSEQLALDWKPPKELYTGRRNASGNLGKITISEPNTLFRAGSSGLETYETLLKILPNVGDSIDWDELWIIINNEPDGIPPKRWKEKIKDRVYTINTKLGDTKFRWTKGKITRVAP